MQCKNIPDLPILEFLNRHKERWCTWGAWTKGMPTVAEAMPENTPDKLQMAKMRKLIGKGLVDGCICGCRGDYEITQKGIAYLENYPSAKL